MNCTCLIHQLENWYIKNKRDLPFRKTNDPYAIWVSEIMLQQTKIDTVIPYYNRLMKKYPTVEALAKTSQEALLMLLEGIGYYRRFKNLLLASKVIVNKYQGVFPKTYDEIISLPGIGSYTAGAIMSIAFNQPFAATDGNVIRVLSRVYLVKDDMRLEKNKKIIQRINQSLIAQAEPEVYTQALMELGALICLPRKPLCHHCPVQAHCLAYQHKCFDELPMISKLPKKPTKHFICLVLQKGNKVYLRKRTESLLEGMFEYPQFQLNSLGEVIQHLERQNVFISETKMLKQYKHIFTHQKWVMDVYCVQLESSPLNEWIEIDIDALLTYPMSKAHRQINIESLFCT